MQQLWSEVDKNADGKLDRKEIKKLLEKINFNASDEYFEIMFKKHDEDKSNTIELNEFFKLMEELRSHPEVDKIFVEKKEKD